MDRRRSRPAGRILHLALAAVAALIALLPGAALAQDGAGADAGADLRAEQELAQRFSPIVMLKQQTEEKADGCHTDGEPWLPAPVDVTFHPDVRLQAPAGEATPQPALATLFGLGDGHYVDLPGHPREDVCQYERDFPRFMGDRDPVVYAHVATEEGEPGLALQYWFFYWFNDFNNRHEGDWEMVQLRFAADTAEEALAQDPVSIAFAQHESGEVTPWTAPKLEREGDRPVVYPARGSHATYYGPAVWIGWGADGSGFGCDDTTGPSFRVDPEVVLLPSTVSDPGDPAAWIAYGGRWGERNSGFFNGPTGPNMKPRWTEPMTWQDNLRRSSVALGLSPVIGPAATDTFCELAADGSALYTLSQPQPWLVALVLAILLAAAVVSVRAAAPSLRAAWGLYRSRPRLFLGLGAVLAPISLVVSGFLFLLNDVHAVASRLPFTEDNEVVRALAQAAISAQGLLMSLVVAPAVMWATREVLDGRSPGVREALKLAVRRSPRTAVAQLMALVALILMSVTIVLLPLAANRGVRWAFAPQAVMLDDRKGRDALRAASDATRGRWWKIALSWPTLAFFGAALGPVLGILLLVFGRMPAQLANGFGAVVYALINPLAVIGFTLLYLAGERGDAEIARQARAAVAASKAAPEPEPAAGLAPGAAD